MTTTPTIWKTGFYPNIGAQLGNQTVPQTIGLANGNILVVWEDDTKGPRPFIDIMGQMFTAEGDETNRCCPGRGTQRHINDRMGETRPD